MNVIQLYVNDSGSGTPFEEGLNTIVIPTSLFTETIFNAHVQNETLSETPIYSSDEELFKFISVDRDGYTKQACEEIDFIIIRFDISSEDAMEMLSLLLECLVNETTNETAIVYSYASTKENATTAVMMNLPFSVLGLIPWYCNFSNSPMGSKPETFEDWFWKPLKTIEMAIVGVIVTIGMAFVELFMMMIDFFAAIFMEILPILAYILWLIIRVALLILIWVIFAITISVLIISYISISVTVLLFQSFLDFEMNIGLNKLTTNGDLNINAGYIIGIEYNSFLRFYIPTINFYFESNRIDFDFTFSFSSFNITFSEFPDDIINTTQDDWATFLGSVGSALGLCGGGFGLVSVGASQFLNDFGMKFTVLNVLWMINLRVSIDLITSNFNKGNLAKYTNIGMGIGFLIATVAAIFPSIFIGLAKIVFGPDAQIVLKTVMIILGFFSIRLKLWEQYRKDQIQDQFVYKEFKSQLSILTGWYVITLGCFALMTLSNMIVNAIIALITFTFGLIFIEAGFSSDK